ncbi:MAG: hypothetical protein WCI03_10075 [bacterium]
MSDKTKTVIEIHTLPPVALSAIVLQDESVVTLSGGNSGANLLFVST